MLTTYGTAVLISTRWYMLRTSMHARKRLKYDMIKEPGNTQLSLYDAHVNNHTLCINVYINHNIRWFL